MLYSCDARARARERKGEGEGGRGRHKAYNLIQIDPKKSGANLRATERGARREGEGGDSTENKRER